MKPRKDEEIFGLLKIPDKEIIRQLRIELGKATSEIDHLKHLLESDSPSEIKSLRGTIKGLCKERNENEYYKKYKVIKNELIEARKTIGALVGKIYILEQKINEKRN